MSWALVVAVMAVGAWWWTQRARGPRSPGTRTKDVDVPAGGVRPVVRRTAERGIDTRTLLEAFRTDELPVPEDSERNDRALLVRMLNLLGDQVGAQAVVLWEPERGDDGGRLVAAVWSRGAAPPAVAESERLLVELAASEQSTTASPSGADLRLLSVGVALPQGRGAVSVHFDEKPACSRADLSTWVARFAPEIAARQELVQARATLAMRNKRLRNMVRTATTLQGSRDPIALEEAFVHDAAFVAGAAWGFLVRGNRERDEPAIVRVSDGVPSVFREQLTARRDTIVGEVFHTGRPRVIGDARAVVASREPVIDDTPLPSGTGSFLAVPVRRSEKEPCIGVLVCGHPERNAFSNSDSHAAQDLSTIAAGALDTAWAWQDATRSAKTDQLTGLPNRRAFEEEFVRMTAETDRFGGESALVIVDLDHFKRVNDSYGHDAGDQVLKAVGATLLAMARTTDKVARLGGEELAILLPQTDRAGAIEAAERCRRAIEELVVASNVGPLRTTASFGVALYAARSGAGGSLFDRADQALYAAKHGGRNRVALAP